MLHTYWLNLGWVLMSWVSHRLRDQDNCCIHLSGHPLFQSSIQWKYDYNIKQRKETRIVCNRMKVNPKSSYERILMAPPCRLTFLSLHYLSLNNWVPYLQETKRKIKRTKIEEQGRENPLGRKPCDVTSSRYKFPMLRSNLLIVLFSLLNFFSPLRGTKR